MAPLAVDKLVKVTGSCELSGSNVQNTRCAGSDALRKGVIVASLVTGDGFCIYWEVITPKYEELWREHTSRGANDHNLRVRMNLFDLTFLALRSIA